MADLNIADITARLRADTTDFARGMQEAIRLLQQFGQAKDAVIANIGRLQQSLQGTGQTFQQFNTQINATQQQFVQAQITIQQFNTQLTQTNTTINQASQGARNLGTSWLAMLQIAGGIGLATSIQGIVRSLVNLLTESVQTAAKMQDLARSFTALEGSTRAANATLGLLFQTAQQAGLGFTGLAEGFRRLEAGSRGTTLSSEELKRAIEGIALGARVMGLGTEQSSHALVAWEQILTKGKLSSEELVRQLGNAVPGGLNIVARSLGVTTAQLRAMAEGGIIPGTLAFTAFAEEMRRIGQSTGPIESLSSTFARLKNETLAWMTAIGESIGQTLQPWLDKLTEMSVALRALLGIRDPGVQALGAGAAQPEGPFTAATKFPIAPSAFTPLIQQEARRSVVDPGLLSQVVRVESGFNPQARSPAGALGLGQLMLPTAQGLEMGATAETLLEPERNLRLAAKYLSEQLERFRGLNDQVKLALAAYNAGPGTVERLLDTATRTTGNRSFAAIEGQLPQQTQRYVSQVLDLSAPGAGQSPAGQAVQTTEAQQKIVDQWTKSIKDTIEQVRLLKTQVESLAASGDNVGAVFSKDIAQQADRLVQRLADIAQAFATLPALAGKLTPVLRAQVTEALQEASIWKERTLTDQRRAELLRQQVEHTEQLVSHQKAQLTGQRQGQEEAERFARLDAARLQEARLKERPERAGLTVTQQIAQDAARLQDLQTQAAALGAELEARRVQAMRPQLDAELQRLQAFLGRPGTSLPAQAEEQVRVQGQAAQAAIETKVRELSRHPALQDLQESYQGLLQGFQESVDTQAALAFKKTDEQMRDTLTHLGTQVDQIRERIGAAGLSPLEADLARIHREFTAMLAQLTALDTKLGEEFPGATEARRDDIAAIRARIADTKPLLGTAEADSVTERQLRPETAYLTQLRTRLEQLQTPKDTEGAALFGPTRADIALRAAGTKELQTEGGKQQAKALQDQITAQERLNYLGGVFDQLGQSVAQSWSSALTKLLAPAEDDTARVLQLTDVSEKLAGAQQHLADLRMSQSRVNRDTLGTGAQESMRLALSDSEKAVNTLDAQRRALENVEHGTNRVAEAFREMARAILQSLTQIAAQEGFRALFRAGFGLLTSALGGGASGGGGVSGEVSQGAWESGVSAAFSKSAQGGAIVNRPTTILAGENPSMNPEYVVNHPQMQALMQRAVQAAPSAGGQALGGAGITIINVATRGEAEAQAAQQRAMGRQVVINEVLGDLQLGESSKINRMIRTLQR